MDARETVVAYYDALRDGRPLAPFFAADRESGDDPVKFGVSETLVGTDEIRAGLAGQTATTTGWVVESRALRSTERERHAWFSDEVSLAWTDTNRGIRFEFETRWSGMLERRTDGDHGDASDASDVRDAKDASDASDAGDAKDASDAGDAGDADGDGPAWRFVGMHVSTSDEL